MKFSRILSGPFLVLISIFLVAKNALADYRNYCGWGTYPGIMNWSWVGLLFMVIFWVLIIILIILLIRRLLSSGTGRISGPPPEDSALEILKKRYARGEVNKEEFEDKKKDLV